MASLPRQVPLAAALLQGLLVVFISVGDGVSQVSAMSFGYGTVNVTVLPSMEFLRPETEVFPICRLAGPANILLSSKNAAPYTWKGWGCTLSWYANYIGGLPEDQLNNLLDLNFDPQKGLGFNIVKYSIGAGYNPRFSPQFDAKFDQARFDAHNSAGDSSYNRSLLTAFKAIPTFSPDPNGPYDWSADADQRRVMFGAKARGVSTFLAQAFSPPHWMTVSGDVAGSADGSCNLKPEYFQAFADYITDVVQHYAQSGIEFATLGAVNEPQEGEGWRRGGWQEGSNFNVEEMNRLLPMVQRALQRKNSKTKLIGTDCWALSTARHFPRLSKAVTDSISEMYVHGYTNHLRENAWYATEGAYSFVRNISRALNKEVWMSEWTWLNLVGGPTDLALAMARNIMETVNYMGAAAWVTWQPVLGTTVTMRFDPQRKWTYPHTLQKRFWVIKHFTAYAPPGSIPVIPSSPARCEHCVTAFYNTGAKNLAFFVVNQRREAVDVTLNLEGFVQADMSTGCEVRMIRTSDQENFQDLGPVGSGYSQRLTVVAAGRSLTTVLLSNLNMVR